MKKINLNVFNKKNKDKDETKEYVLNDKTDFDTVETYKAIRTNIMFSAPKTDKGKVIVITLSLIHI